MTALRAPSGTATVVLAGALLLACGANRRNGFYSGGISVGVTADAEGSLRAAFANYHVPHDAVDCMVAEAFKRPPTTEPGTYNYHWTRDELDTYATACGVDSKEVWLTID